MRCGNLHEVTEQFYDKILNFVKAKVSDIELSKDITQEVMGRLIDAYDKQIEIQNLNAWLFKVSKNVIADYYKKKNIVEYSDNEFDFVQDVPKFEITAQDFLEPMIKLLPVEYSIPLLKSDIQKLKQAQIAEELNLSLSAVKMRCKRGRQMLHDMFMECCDIAYSQDGSFKSCTLKSSCDVLIEEENKLKKKLFD
jgi:RNA polymerase sigma-70 factor (ECF subfamily)